MKKISIFIIGLFLASCSCGSEQKENHSEHKHEHKKEAKKEVNHHGTAKSVELNNGQKWEANIETTQGIEKMQQLIAELDGSTELVDFQMVGKELKAEFAMIFKKCTMDGEAHDNLHNYLLPTVQVLDKLQGDDLEESQKATKVLKTHFGKYGNFFQ